VRASMTFSGACLAVAGAAAAFGCAKAERLNGGADAAVDAIGNIDMGLTFDSGPEADAPDKPPKLAVVYVHTFTDLYTVDPDTLEVAHAAEFIWPEGGGQEMTDIAVDGKEKVVGISFGNVYDVDPETGVCALLSAFSNDFNALSFLPDPNDPDSGTEILVGVALDGQMVQIDTVTGTPTPIGDYGSDWQSSGDLVYVEGAGIFATVWNESDVNDALVSIDLKTGMASLIGFTTTTGIWGLGFWGGDVYGFRSNGDFFLIDPATAETTFVSTESPLIWAGAGNTTQAPPGPD
jgi:hypothetical protein